MVNDTVTDVAAPERRLALVRAPADRRDGLAALFALDDRFGEILRTTREPMVGQMRLTWWHGALTALDTAPVPAEPVLQALAETVLPRGPTGGALAAQVDGWEVLLEQAAPDDAAMATFAGGRGGALFAAAATVLGAADTAVSRAGEAWALCDLARNLSDARASARAQAMAGERMAGVFSPRWSRAARPLGLMTLAAWLDLEGRGGVARAGRLARHLAIGA